MAIAAQVSALTAKILGRDSPGMPSDEFEDDEDDEYDEEYDDDDDYYYTDEEEGGERGLNSERSDDASYSTAFRKDSNDLMDMSLSTSMTLAW